jgi:CheY-like chemotaxis protein
VHRVPGRDTGAVYAFCTELDRWMESSPVVADAVAKNGPFPYRILFVDDEKNIRQTGKALLESQGYEIQVAEDGFDALNHLSQSLPDILITDLRMPNMSGFELLSVVRKRFPQIGVIAVSAEFFPTGATGALLADAFIPKSQSPSEMFAKIITLLEQAPIRPSTRGSETAAVWIPRSKKDYVVVTCPYCLRTSPAPEPVGDEIEHLECPHCARVVNFRMVPKGSSPRSQDPVLS